MTAPQKCSRGPSSSSSPRTSGWAASTSSRRWKPWPGSRSIQRRQGPGEGLHRVLTGHRACGTGRGGDALAMHKRPERELSLRVKELEEKLRGTQSAIICALRQLLDLRDLN